MRSDIRQCIDKIGNIVRGKQTQIELSLVCILANGHLLLEDLPGMGKTTLSQALATTLGLDYARIQFTSDLLPADMLGVNIFNQSNNEFTFHGGPIFNQIVLADEINRASPKTQSALLEAMAERQVTIDGETYKLPDPFFVIASQNPLHQSGTHPLPESQLDRFQMQISLGYPDFESEKQMLLRQDSPLVLDTMLPIETLTAMQQSVSKVIMSDSVINYLLKLVRLTRESSDFPNALSPRATKAIFRCAQAYAFINRRDFVTPEDIQFILPSVTEHRLRGQLYNQTGSSYSEHLLQQVDPLAA
ncbi:AAA family ATPase [Agaribacter marinus]|uniref:ATPase AAA n=1 Tax=Agaribacter marinus TaxID=1431249 RepID=A0AA37SXA7_9ALTE|nr:MoxR family ATPase [Agaribacter marinus]GLR70229.1 ATPase AAA [Agaribacter marinus]